MRMPFVATSIVIRTLMFMPALHTAGVRTAPVMAALLVALYSLAVTVDCGYCPVWPPLTAWGVFNEALTRPHGYSSLFHLSNSFLLFTGI